MIPNSKHYFFPEDIDVILTEIKKSLTGEGLLTKGPLVEEFELKYSEFIGSKFAISTNSCTTALEIVLKSLIKDDKNEIIVPSQTFFSTGSSVINSGGIVKFCDTDSNFSADFDSIKSLITKKTKAVIVVHYAGLIQENVFEIKHYLKQRGILLIEDCAHSTGASINGVMSGNIGDFGCHSFYSTKIITTGEGGMITFNDKSYYNEIKSTRSIGIDTISNKEVFTNFGSNYRMAEIPAILGLNQLKNINVFIDHRNKIANFYRLELSSLSNSGKIRFQEYNPENTTHTFWKFIVFIEDESIDVNFITKEIISKNNFNITSPYKPLLHHQPAFKKLYPNLILSNSERLSKQHIALPINMHISLEVATMICTVLKKHI